MKAYFYCNTALNPDWAYHDYIVIAEGLTALGVDCRGNKNMYQARIGADFLIRFEDEHELETADIVFFHFSIYRMGITKANRLIKTISKPANRRYKTVFIDANDGVRTDGFRSGARSCDYVLKTHYNKKYRYPKNFIPWQFGLTNRMLEAVEPLPFEQRERKLLVNFRQKHQLRDYVNGLIRPLVEPYFAWDSSFDNFSADNFSDYDTLMWKQTNSRHNPDYYQKLSQNALCACYGGVFALPYGNYNKYTAKLARTINAAIPIFKWDRVRQWDSWRLWEAWAAGAVVVHVDLEKYGCLLPVMPQNGIHYIGIDPENLQNFETLLRDETRLAAIAAAGRQFVVDNYHPKVLAERLLALVGLTIE